MNIDKDYIIKLRRELHEYPEIGFELPRTIALVKRELEAMNIPYTEQYGKSSVVATINPDSKIFTIGIRADMDALLIREKTELSYSSKIEGQMHACGHDAHTAMLLGTAKALKALEGQLACRIKLLFQPSEEGKDSGAELMVKDGVMDDIDVIIGMHIENWLPSGHIGVCKGASMASSRTVKLAFFGKTAHATLPQSGVDALSAAVKTYNNIQLMLTREIDPFQRHICSVGRLSGGTTQNVIADYAEMLISVRAYSDKTDKHIAGRIDQIARHAAEEIGATVKIENELKAYVIYNDPQISDSVLASAEKVVGGEGISEMPAKMSSEDFSHYLTKKPGVFFRLGTRSEEKGITSLPHNNDFVLDEDALPIGSRVCVQFVLDNMKGLEGRVYHENKNLCGR